jgi:RNA polymerase sigma factor (sigma-70 family)
MQDTMVQAWKSAHTFQGGGDGDPDGARRRALAWLGRIARNHYWGTRRRKITLVNDAIEQEDEDENASHKDEPRSRRLGKLHHEIEKAVNLVADVVESGADADSIHRQLLREALVTLTDRERDVILTTYEHYEPGQQQQRRLPKEVVAEICSKFTITPENLRQIRKRTDAKIRQYVTEHMPAEMRS